MTTLDEFLADQASKTPLQQTVLVSAHRCDYAWCQETADRLALIEFVRAGVRTGVVELRSVCARHYGYVQATAEVGK